MINEKLKRQIVDTILADAFRVLLSTWAVNSTQSSRTTRTVRGKLAFAFPDTYSLGMSHHGMEVLYNLMNRRDDWVCERTFTPWVDFEEQLRKANSAAVWLGDLHAAQRVRRAWASHCSTRSARSMC